MENLIDVSSTGQLSFLLLNEYFLLDLMDYLELEDLINLAGTCTHLRTIVNRRFRKYARMRLDEHMALNTDEYIYLFFGNFGHHVVSLIIESCWVPFDWRIVGDCKNLKRLEMCGIWAAFDNGPSSFTINNLEVLSFFRCDSKCVQSVLKVVRKVKALSIDCCYCYIESNALMTMFKNSPNIESFVWWNNLDSFDFHLLQIIPNVERLCLHVELESVSELLKLNRLSKLKLFCDDKNVTSFLSELAKKGIIQELELISVAVDKNFFEVLNTLDSLQLLALCNISDLDFNQSSIVWPPKLKHLRLNNFEFTVDTFLSTVKQLKDLEKIGISFGHVAEDEEDNFKDVRKLSQAILSAIDNCDRKQRLDVIVPCNVRYKEESSKKYLFDSQRLRIYKSGCKSTSDNLEINFPVV